MHFQKECFDKIEKKKKKEEIISKLVSKFIKQLQILHL